MTQSSLAFVNDGTWQEGKVWVVNTGWQYGTYWGPTKTLACTNGGGHYFESQNACAWLGGGTSGWGLIGYVYCHQTEVSDIPNHPLSGCDQTPTPLVKPKALGKTYCSAKNTFGNAISISTGNKFQQEIILSTPLPLTLSYNSLDQQWRHSYAFALNISDSTTTLVRPDGKGLGFTQTNGVWSADDGDVFYTLSAFDNGSGSAWKVTTKSGSTELYDTQGRVLSITSLQDQSLSFSYTGSTTDVSDEFGNVLSLTLDTNERLTSAVLNGAIQASLTYDSEARLISRTDAQNNTVQYHYEDTSFPNHLTGITGADGQRFATWAYDSEGRGILSEHVGQETAQLLFNEDGSTTVTNSLGKQTTYHYEEIEGLKRPVQIEGHASENCVAANQAYTYNANGLVETQTDWSGNITRFEYNDRGLVTRKTVAEGTAQERVTDQVWHETLPLLLQTQSAGRITQYQYDAENRLISTEESPVPSP